MHILSWYMTCQLLVYVPPTFYLPKLYNDIILSWLHNVWLMVFVWTVLLNSSKLFTCVCVCVCVCVRVCVCVCVCARVPTCVPWLVQPGFNNTDWKVRSSVVVYWLSDCLCAVSPPAWPQHCPIYWLLRTTMMEMACIWLYVSMGWMVSVSFCCLQIVLIWSVENLTVKMNCVSE